MPKRKGSSHNVPGHGHEVPVPGQGKTGTFLKNPPGDPGKRPKEKRRLCA